MSTRSFRFPYSSYQKKVAKPGHWIQFTVLTWLAFPVAALAAGKGDLPNFHVVHDYLLRGGEPSDQGLKNLKALGVDVIVDLRAPTGKAQAEKAQAKALGMQYINLPMSSRPPTEQQVNTFLKAVDEKSQLQRVPKDTGEKYPHSVFVHCAHGSDRTGCMVGIWRVSRDHWTYPQAYQEMRKYYFGPQYKQLAEAVRERSTKH
jgi:protein tyrosine/serine phosphatase